MSQLRSLSGWGREIQGRWLQKSEKRLKKLESKAWTAPRDFSSCQRHYTLSKTAAPFDYDRRIGAPYDPESPPAEL